jgi:hypothetical protein
MIERLLTDKVIPHRVNGVLLAGENYFLLKSLRELLFEGKSWDIQWISPEEAIVQLQRKLVDEPSTKEVIDS